MQTTSELYEKGKEVRIAVLGEEHVKRSLAARQSEYAQPLQFFTTEYAWGRVWSRPELDRRSRSLCNLAFLTALHSWNELAIHTKGAIRNGLTEVEIREVVLQAMVYCGVPAGVQALKITEAAINEMIANGEHERQLKEKV
ncbi:putative 4-carboxymuconolactone decarboxylase [Xylogone sp. PMI_703]|nr:putative 4-carboxymuconolactone decarboxylase [Xylogone sp. PMI_703]